MRFAKACMKHPDIIICFMLAVLIGYMVSKVVPGLVEGHYGKVEGEDGLLSS